VTTEELDKREDIIGKVKDYQILNVNKLK